jgi:hypothetical protein
MGCVGMSSYDCEYCTWSFFSRVALIEHLEGHAANSPEVDEWGILVT